MMTRKRSKETRSRRQPSPPPASAAESRWSLAGLAHVSGKAWWQGIAAVVGILSLVVAVIQLSDEPDKTKDDRTTSAGTPSAASSSSPANRQRITWSISHYRDDCSSFILPRPLSQLGTAPPAESLASWARLHGAATALPYGPQLGGVQMIMLTVKGTSSKPVTITELTFEAVDRQPPLAGPEVENPCGDAVTARYAVIDLDHKPPAIVKSSANKSLWGSDVRAEPIRFPYVVSEDDPETLLLIASTHNFVSWRGRIKWGDGETSGTYTIDNEGQPFRTSDASRVTSTHVPDGNGGWV